MRLINNLLRHSQILTQIIIIFCLLENKCQYWLNETLRTLTSPFFEMSSKTSIQYHHNLNCTWILTAGQGFYVNFEIDYFWVNNDKYTPSINRGVRNSKISSEAAKKNTG